MNFVEIMSFYLYAFLHEDREDLNSIPFLILSRENVRAVLYIYDVDIMMYRQCIFQ